MKRLLVLSVASMLGAGCSVHDTCDARTVAVGWPSFLEADNTTTSHCSDLGLATVDVWMDFTGFVGTFNCTDGGVNVTQVTNTDHTFTVEARDTNHNIIVRDEVTVSPSNCSDVLVNTQPAEGFVDIQYDFYDGSTPLPAPQDVCVAGSHLWLQITDHIANEVAYLYSAANASQAPACESSQRTLSLRLPWGAGSQNAYTLDWMEEHAGASNTLTASNCASGGFGIGRAQVTTVAEALNVTAPTLCH